MTLQQLISAGRDLLTRKDHLLIDPTVKPSIGKMVLIGERCELWRGQQGVSGVLAAVWEDD